MAFFNVSSIFNPNGSIIEGRYLNNKAVRTATVAQKFFTVHLLLYKNISDTTLTFTIEGKQGDQPVNVSALVKAYLSIICVVITLLALLFLSVII